jgi:uncharacterized phage protein (TIGR01671 family)
MREILFRGKDIAGNWHYGVPFVFTEDYVCMTAPHTYNKEVEASPVGQYTGLTDKNDNKIFEGDIIQLGHYIGLVEYSELFGKYTVTYNQISGNWFDLESNSCYPLSLECEVIGNIHDNPELLKEGADNG